MREGRWESVIDGLSELSEGEEEKKIFVDISPSSDKRVCSNCESFYRWGVHTGTCNLAIQNDKDNENVSENHYCEGFEYRIKQPIDSNSKEEDESGPVDLTNVKPDDISFLKKQPQPEQELKDELIIALNDYATFLGKVIDKNAMFLNIHGMNASDDDIKKGGEFRDKLETLVKRIKQSTPSEPKPTDACDNWMPDKATSATRCINCGKDRWEHPL